jgi:predicted metal-dependent hydrolase
MTKPDFAHYFLEGIEHFNARRFWNAHESWETLWLEAQSDLVEFLQGLIQLAAAYHHIQRGTLRGAPRLFAAALKRLEPFPRLCCGVDWTAVESAARRHWKWLEDGPESPLESSEYPKLVVPDGSAIAPTSLQW